MPVAINGYKYYRTAEVCRTLGISKATFFRWLKENTIKEAKLRDRRGWRLFDEEEIAAMRVEAYRINETSQSANKESTTQIDTCLRGRR